MELLRYLASFLLLLQPWTTLTNRQPYIKRKENERKTNKATRLLPYRVQSPPPPVTLIITSTSAKIVTFTQTRAHKYLSVRTQMDDIFQGSSLYATSQLQFLHEDKEMGCCGWHSGFWQDPLAYLAGEKTGLCDKDTHTKAVQMKHKLGHCRSRQFKRTNALFKGLNNSLNVLCEGSNNA